MASLDAYGAIRAYLPGNVVTTVNAERADTLVPDAVRWTRAALSNRNPRVDKAHPITVALVPQEPEESIAIGTAVAERSVVIHAEAYHQVKDLPEGAEQMEVPELIQRALINAYDGASHLSIPNFTTFRYVRATPVIIDEAPESTSTAKSVTRLVFVYTEELTASS